MTKPRDHDTLSGVVGRAVDLIGVNAVANAIGKSNSWIYKCADPDNSEAVIRDAETLIAIDRACIRAGKTAPYLSFHAKSVGMTDEQEQDLDDKVHKLAETVGNVARVHRMARDPESPNGSDYSACEARAVRAAIQDVRETCDQVEAAASAAAAPKLTAAAE